MTDTTQAMATTTSAPHAASIPASCVHDVYRAVNAWQRRTGRDLVRLDVGEPHFKPPTAVIDALVAAVRGGRTTYTPAEGLPDLRERLADKLARENDHDTSPGLVLVTPGATQGISALMQSITNPGDEILLPAYHWPIHLQQSLLAGLRPRFYPLDAQFRPDLDALSRMSSDRTRVLLVNTPSNPTGAVYDKGLLQAMLELAHRHDWLVISDEAYEDFVFSGKHVSMAALERNISVDQRRVFTVFSYSKSFAMTGYRLGYVATPNPARAATLQVVQEASILSSPTPMQFAGLAALDSTNELASNRAQLQSARDSLKPLVDLGVVPWLPAGGWFSLLDIGGLGLDAETFASELLERDGVSVAPARGFALRPELRADGSVAVVNTDPAATRHLRLAFCGEPSSVADAVQKIATFIEELREGVRL